VDTVLAIDVGTTALKVGLFGHDGTCKALESAEQSLHHAPGGIVEQDPADAIALIRSCIQRISGKADLQSVDALVISNQRGTVVPMQQDGTPVGSYVVWMDSRGRRWLDWLSERVGRDAYYAVSGHPIVLQTGITKILSIQNDAPGTWRQTVSIGSQSSHLLRWLGSDSIVCDRSTGSFLFPLDVDRGVWSQTLADTIGFPIDRLPSLVDSVDVVGRLRADIAGDLGLPQGTALVAGGGDGQCAGLGAGITGQGEVLINIGTAAGVQAYLESPIRDPRSILNCAVHVVPGAWEMEGHTQASGAALRWFRDAFGMTDDGTDASHGYEALVATASASPAGADGLLFIPTFNGTTAPIPAPDARAALVGLTLSHERRHVVRAILEGVCLEIRWMLEAVEGVTGQASEVRVTGGASRSRPWMQILADVLARPVTLVGSGDAALVGAAICASTAVGAHASVRAAAATYVQVKEVIEPTASNRQAYDQQYGRYLETFRSLQLPSSPQGGAPGWR
jgi:sugar (pentulose or hexulose) kinase